MAKYLDSVGLSKAFELIKDYVDDHGGGGGDISIGDGAPVGTILDFAGSVAPAGYLICDGSAVSRTEYAELFAAIGTTWGSGDGSTTFNLPDLSGRTTIGIGTASGGSSARNLGDTGGAETHHHNGGSHTLTTAEIPAHNHKPSSTTAGQDFRFMAFKPESGVAGSFNLQGHGSGANRYAYASTATANLTYYSSTANAGGGAAHSHGATTDTSSMQPFATVTKIIKAVSGQFNEDFTVNGNIAATGGLTLGGKAVSVWVVETGTDSNGWTYKKYSNGTYRAKWSNDLTLNAGTAWGSGFYFHMQTAAIPVPSFSTSFEVVSAVKNNAQLAFYAGRVASTTALQGYWANNGSGAVSSSTFGKVTYIIEGTY